MKIVTTIFVIFLAQCTYLYAKPKPEFKNSCINGVKSVTVFLHNSQQNIAINKSCDNINSSQPIAFLCHGFRGSAYGSKMQELASNLKDIHDYTVLIIDWSQPACAKDVSIVNYVGYPWAVNNTQVIGHFMANYTNFLIKECSVPLKNIIFIGHSLGAHVSGFAAKKVAEENEDKIPLIIAADPAGPMFHHKDCKARLCESDAKYVVVLHTSLTFGMWYPMGYCDFFFNDGKMQPGCDILKMGSCSHSRAMEYLIDITEDNRCGFPAVPKTSSPSYPNFDTKDCIMVNYSIIFNRNNSMKGNYSVFVKAKSPHCTYETFKCSKQVVEFETLISL